MKHLLLFTICGALILPAATRITKDDIPLDSTMSFVFDSDVPIETKMVNAKTWIAKTYGDYKAVLQYEDAESHRIIIKGRAPISVSVSGDASGTYTASFTTTFDFKDDRFRIKYEDIRLTYTVSYHGHNLDLDTTLEEFFTPIKTERYITEKKQQLEKLLKIDRSKMWRKDREKFEKEISDLENDIKERKLYLETEALETVSKHINDYRSSFCDLINSAVDVIDDLDDF
jgi:hypothetical protein